METNGFTEDRPITLDGLLIIYVIMKKMFLFYGDVDGCKTAICLCT